MQIRKMKHSDQITVAKIYQEDRTRYFPWVAAPDLTDFKRDSQREAVFVAEINGDIAGFVSLNRVMSFIHLLFVAPAYQHQGVGHALIDMMRREASGPLTLKCVIDNVEALKFYDHEGFIIKREDHLAVPANYTLIDMTGRG